MLYGGLAKGTYFLAFVEALERFSYYGMRGLLVLFVTSPVASGGLGWADTYALSLYGYYTAAVWMAPLAGGWIADRYLGSRACVVIGGWVMVAGLALLTGSSAWQSSAAQSGGVTSGSHRLVVASLTVLVSGVGLLKGNITVMLGRLYSRTDPRREDAFSLYYVAINLGVVLSALIAGTLGERLGWTYGFAACALILLCGMTLFTIRQRIMLSDDRDDDQQLQHDPAITPAGAMTFVGVLLIFSTLFFAAYEQSGGLINLLMYRQADRMAGDFEIPATWFLASTGIFCIMIGPFVPGMFERLRARGIGTGTVERFALGLLLTSAAYGVFAIGLARAGGGQFTVVWPLAFYLILTFAELSLAPAGFAMATRYAPPQAAGRFVGLWLLSIAAGSVLGGQLGAIAILMPAGEFTAVLSACVGVAALVLFRIRKNLGRLVAGQ